jgi:hypothetical protein
LVKIGENCMVCIDQSKIVGLDGWSHVHNCINFGLID